MAAFERVDLGVVSEIVDILKFDVPGGIVPCQMLEMYRECKKNVPDLDVRLFTPGGQIDPHGTFFLYVPEHRGNILFHTTDPDMDKLKIRIQALSDIDWTTYPCIGPVDDRFDQMVQKLMLEEGLNFAATPNPADNLMMPRDKALSLNVKIPDGLELRPITVDQAGFINDRWPHKAPKTLQYLEDTIKTKGGLALYDKVSNEMLSWALFSLVGGVGMIQTAEEHRGKRYADIVGKAMTKIVAQTGFEPQLQIRHNLPSSMQLFTRMGYKFTHIVHWYWIGRKSNKN